MASKLEIKKVRYRDYATLKSETTEFQQPVIFSMDGNDLNRLQMLGSKIKMFESQHRRAAFKDSEGFKQLLEIKTYFRGDDSSDIHMYSPSIFYLTKDKLVSPVEYTSPHYCSILEEVVHFFFKSSLLKSRLHDTSLLQKVILFMTLQKGIFGAFKLDHLSNFANVSFWYKPNGDINTIVHVDNLVSNFFWQLQGSKTFWIASPFQNKQSVQSLISKEVSEINPDDFDDLEYYSFEVGPNECLFLPFNWLHGVTAAAGENVSLSFKFPMTLREMVTNFSYWKSPTVPSPLPEKSTHQDDQDLVDINQKQSDTFGRIKFCLRQHSFASRQVLADEPSFVSGFFDPKPL